LQAITLYDKFGNFFRIDAPFKRLYWVAQEVGEQADEEPTGRAHYDNGYVLAQPVGGAKEIEPTDAAVRSLVNAAFTQRLLETGYDLRGYTAFHPRDEISHRAVDVYRLFSGFEYRVTTLENGLALVINPKIAIRTVASIQYLVEHGIEPSRCSDFSVYFSPVPESPLEGYLLSTEKEGGVVRCNVRGFLDQPDVSLGGEVVFPESRPELLDWVLEMLGRPVEAIQLLRQRSMISSRTASRDRLALTLDIAKRLASDVFPLDVGGTAVSLDVEPAIVRT
jgi:hypothetical protein